MPNLLVLCFDQLPTWLLGFMGNGDVKTPNLDSLASKSVVFDRAYATSPEISFREIITQHNEEQLAVDFLSQPSSESHDLFFGRLIDQISRKPSNPQTIIFADAIGVSVSDFSNSLETNEETTAERAESDADSDAPFHEFIHQLDHQLGTLFEKMKELDERWTLIITASRGFDKCDESDMKYSSHSRVHIPLIIHDDTKRHCERDSRFIDLKTLAEITLLSAMKNESLYRVAKSVLTSQRRDALLIEDSSRGVTWRSADHCLKLPETLYEKLNAKPVDFMKTATEWEIEEFTCEAQLFLKPEDFWEHNDVSRQFPETTNQILAEILAYSHQQKED